MGAGRVMSVISARHRIRGIAEHTVAWGMLWVPLSLVVQLVYNIALSDSGGAQQITVLARGSAILGAMNGFVFGVLIAVMESRRAFVSLPYGRAVAWGVVAATPPVIVGFLFGGNLRADAVVAALIVLGLGGISGAATLALHRYLRPA